ncbi:MAG: ABC transporter ATP-binding protein [Actinomycetota bacterium]
MVTDRVPLLAVDRLVVRVGGVAGFDAVDGVSFVVKRGETVAVVGESGSGKSLTMLAIAGLLPGAATMTGGEVRIDGVSTASLDDRGRREVCRRRIGMVFQDPLTSLNPVLTVGAQVREAVRVRAGLRGAPGEAMAVDLLDQVGIVDPRRRADSYPHELSGGMRQRVMIAMALAGDPELLIADEATTALDVTVQAQILDLVETMQRIRGLAVVWVTHDLGVVARVASQVLVMYAGRLVETGPVRAAFDHPAHHYTAGLIGSMPRFDLERDVDLSPVRGRPPRPDERAHGCAFAPRCDGVIDVCAVRPELVSFADDNRAVACWHPLTQVRASHG